jgi:hypothetical protein
MSHDEPLKRIGAISLSVDHVDDVFVIFFTLAVAYGKKKDERAKGDLPAAQLLPAPPPSLATKKFSGL